VLIVAAAAVAFAITLYPVWPKADSSLNIGIVSQSCGSPADAGGSRGA
jgi:hypothetical protein